MRNWIVYRNHSADNAALNRMTLPCLREYCDRWGYDFVDQFMSWEQAKREVIGELQRLLRHSQHLMVLGSDVLITNHAISLDSLADTSVGVQMSADFTATPINNDVQLIHANAQGGWYLDMMAAAVPTYLHRQYFLQQAVVDLMASRDDAKLAIKIEPVRKLQSFDYGGVSISWQAGDFAVHAPGGAHADKVKRLEPFLRKIIH